MADQNKTEEETKVVYHYTGKKKAAMIRKSGVIKPSAEGAFGGDKNTQFLFIRGDLFVKGADRR